MGALHPSGTFRRLRSPGSARSQFVVCHPEVEAMDDYGIFSGIFPFFLRIKLIKLQSSIFFSRTTTDLPTRHGHFPCLEYQRVTKNGWYRRKRRYFKEPLETTQQLTLLSSIAQIQNTRCSLNAFHPYSHNVGKTMFTTHFPGFFVYLYHLYIKMVILCDFPGGWFIVSYFSVYCLSTFSGLIPMLRCFGIDDNVVGVNPVQNVEVVVGSNQETTMSLEFIGYP